MKSLSNPIEKMFNQMRFYVSDLVEEECGFLWSGCIWDILWREVEDQLWNQIRDPITGQVCDQVRTSIRNQLDEQFKRLYK